MDKTTTEACTLGKHEIINKTRPIANIGMTYSLCKHCGKSQGDIIDDGEYEESN